MRLEPDNFDDVGGRGGGFYPLYETEIGKWLALGRIQSVPVTVISLCLGYLTVSETVFSLSIWPLVAVGLLGHLSVYMHNDIVDYEHDMRFKDSKPLLEGLDKDDAVDKQRSLIMISLLFGAVYMGESSFFMFCLSVAVGLVYNIRSKSDWFSSLYLFIWGITITMTGALYHGSINDLTLMAAFAVGVQMFVFTVLGDIKDINADEPSIPHNLGKARKTSSNIISMIDVRKAIVIYSVVSTSAIILLFGFYTDLLSVVVLALSATVWGLSWQKIQYGSAFYFP